MCIAAFAWQIHPLQPFLLLLNRDEYHDRATKPLGWWEGGEILGGRDEVGGGTWLACSRKGKIAFVTNVLELHTLPQAKSRGDLPVRFLKSTKNPREFAEMLLDEEQEYNGFNLILADLPTKTMVYVTNRPKGDTVIKIQDVEPGLHVLSNANLDSPWPKVERLRVKFTKILHRFGEGEIPLADVINRLMRDRKKADKSKLPRICPVEWEFGLSPIFVKVDTPLGYYGTRSTAAITVSTNGEVNFYETYLENGLWQEKTVNYSIDKKKLI
ncbi:hypothetical protein vseg_001600 [Gypsophila vaccaria]